MRIDMNTANDSLEKSLARHKYFLAPTNVGSAQEEKPPVGGGCGSKDGLLAQRAVERSNADAGLLRHVPDDRVNERLGMRAESDFAHRCRRHPDPLLVTAFG